MKTYRPTYHDQIASAAWLANHRRRPRGKDGRTSYERTMAAWALLTADPMLSRRRLAAHLGCAPSQAQHAVRDLVIAGYIETPARGACVIRIPCYTPTPKRSL